MGSKRHVMRGKPQPSVRTTWGGLRPVYSAMMSREQLRIFKAESDLR